jgi:hypothetical protein
MVKYTYVKLGSADGNVTMLGGSMMIKKKERNNKNITDPNEIPRWFNDHESAFKYPFTTFGHTFVWKA